MQNSHQPSNSYKWDCFFQAFSQLSDLVQQIKQEETPLRFEVTPPQNPQFFNEAPKKFIEQETQSQSEQEQRNPLQFFNKTQKNPNVLANRLCEQTRKLATNLAELENERKSRAPLPNSNLPQTFYLRNLEELDEESDYFFQAPKTKKIYTNNGAPVRIPKNFEISMTKHQNTINNSPAEAFDAAKLKEIQQMKLRNKLLKLENDQSSDDYEEILEIPLKRKAVMKRNRTNHEKRVFLRRRFVDSPEFLAKKEFFDGDYDEYYDEPHNIRRQNTNYIIREQQPNYLMEDQYLRYYDEPNMQIVKRKFPTARYSRHSNHINNLVGKRKFFEDNYQQFQGNFQEKYYEEHLPITNENEVPGEESKNNNLKSQNNFIQNNDKINEKTKNEPENQQKDEKKNIQADSTFLKEMRENSEAINPKPSEKNLKLANISEEKKSESPNLNFDQPNEKTLLNNINIRAKPQQKDNNSENEEELFEISKPEGTGIITKNNNKSNASVINEEITVSFDQKKNVLSQKGSIEAKNFEKKSQIKQNEVKTTAVLKENSCTQQKIPNPIITEPKIIEIKENFPVKNENIEEKEKKLLNNKPDENSDQTKSNSSNPNNSAAIRDKLNENKMKANENSANYNYLQSISNQTTKTVAFKGAPKGKPQRKSPVNAELLRQKASINQQQDPSEKTTVPQSKIINDYKNKEFKETKAKNAAQSKDVDEKNDELLHQKKEKQPDNYVEPDDKFARTIDIMNPLAKDEEKDYNEKHSLDPLEDFQLDNTDQNNNTEKTETIQGDSGKFKGLFNTKLEKNIPKLPSQQKKDSAQIKLYQNAVNLSQKTKREASKKAPNYKALDENNSESESISEEPPRKKQKIERNSNKPKQNTQRATSVRAKPTKKEQESSENSDLDDKEIDEDYSPHSNKKKTQQKNRTSTTMNTKKFHLNMNLSSESSLNNDLEMENIKDLSEYLKREVNKSESKDSSISSSQSMRNLTAKNKKKVKISPFDLELKPNEPDQTQINLSVLQDVSHFVSLPVEHLVPLRNCPGEEPDNELKRQVLTVLENDWVLWMNAEEDAKNSDPFASFSEDERIDIRYWAHEIAVTTEHSGFIVRAYDLWKERNIWYAIISLSILKPFPIKIELNQIRPLALLQETLRTLPWGDRWTDEVFKQAIRWYCVKNREKMRKTKYSPAGKSSTSQNSKRLFMQRAFQLDLFDPVFHEDNLIAIVESFSLKTKETKILLRFKIPGGYRYRFLEKDVFLNHVGLNPESHRSITSIKEIISKLPIQKVRRNVWILNFVEKIRYYPKESMQRRLHREYKELYSSNNMTPFLCCIELLTEHNFSYQEARIIFMQKDREKQISFINATIYPLSVKVIGEETVGNIKDIAEKVKKIDKSIVLLGTMKEEELFNAVAFRNGNGINLKDCVLQNGKKLNLNSQEELKFIIMEIIKL